MSRAFVNDITNYMHVVFRNVRDCLLTCDMDAVFFNVPIWKHAYHMLHSLDRWFINPTVYDEPPFHRPELNNIDIPPDDFALSREDLLRYFEEIKAKLFQYLDTLDDEMLLQTPTGCQADRMTLIMAQFRHLYAHLGNINATTISATGKWPFVANYSYMTPSDRIWE
ncbi:MAG: hypothetical protein LBL82_07365 [Oscillospiraceae bacterium]|jgi:hypothetical protein|nr:hypothetical protein [Oscillospiraceae bacterium]